MARNSWSSSTLQRKEEHGIERGKKMVDGKIETEEEEEESGGKKGERRGGTLLSWRVSTKHAVTVQWRAAPRGERGPARGEEPLESVGVSARPMKEPIEKSPGNLAFRGSPRETAYTFGINVTGWTVKICVRSLIGRQYRLPTTVPTPPAGPLPILFVTFRV